MFTKMFWVAGLFLDVYKDVPGYWGVSRCLQRCSGLFLDVYKDVLGCWVVSRCLQRCSGLLGCF